MSDFTEQDFSQLSARDQFLGQLEPKCRTCPVILKFIAEVDGIAEAAKDASIVVFRGLGDNCMSEETMQSQVKRLDHLTDRELESRKVLTKLVENADPKCAGSRPGSGLRNRSRAERLFDIFCGQRVCQNPAFKAFIDNRVIGEVLQVAWNPAK